MGRKLVVAGVVLAFSLGIACAEEFFARISKVEDGKVTFVKFKKGDKKGEEATLPVADKVKVVKGKFDFKSKKVEAGDALEGGLSNERFKKIGEKGLFAQLVTDEDGKKITEIRVMDFGKKKKKKDDDK